MGVLSNLVTSSPGLSTPTLAHVLLSAAHYMLGKALTIAAANHISVDTILFIGRQVNIP